MIKYKSSIVIIVILILLSALGIYYYEKYKNQNVQEGYQFLIGLSLPNSTIERHAHLIHQVSEGKKDLTDSHILVKEAQDSASQQLKDIQELEKSGIDLLILSPIKDEVIFRKVKSLDIPVIILHEKDFKGYGSAFIGYNNLKAGRLLGEEVLKEKDKNDILVLAGEKSDIISLERREGFLQVTKDKMNIEISYCHWSRNEAENSMKAYLVSGKHVSKVVGLNDQMAYGAYLACQKFRESNIDLYGINGFLGAHQGRDLVKRNMIEKSIGFEDLYKKMIETAVSILENKDYDKEIILDCFVIE